MQTQQEIKDMVKTKYSEIANQSKNENESSCCGSGCCSTEVYNIMTDDYSNLKGYNPDADLGWVVAYLLNMQKLKRAILLLI